MGVHRLGSWCHRVGQKAMLSTPDWYSTCLYDWWGSGRQIHVSRKLDDTYNLFQNWAPQYYITLGNEDSAQESDQFRRYNLWLWVWCAALTIPQGFLKTLKINVINPQRHQPGLVEQNEFQVCVPTALHMRFLLGLANVAQQKMNIAKRLSRWDSDLIAMYVCSCSHVLCLLLFAK